RGGRSLSKRTAPGTWRMSRHRARAQALVFLTAMLPLFLGVIGLALNGGHLFDERANLQAIADASARAGAVQLDTARMYASGAGASAPQPSHGARGDLGRRAGAARRRHPVPAPGDRAANTGGRWLDCGSCFSADAKRGAHRATADASTVNAGTGSEPDRRANS